MAGRALWLDRALITSPYHIGLCKTPEAFERALKQLKIPREDRPEFVIAGAAATAHAFEKDDGKLCAIVCIDSHKRRRHEANGLLVHEAMHVWRWIRESMGERQPSSEFEAYSMQTISQRLMEAYWSKPTHKNR